MTLKKSQNINPVKTDAGPTAVELRREGRLLRIARAIAEGKTVTEIAEAEGIGRTLASREANSAECKQLIATFVDEEHELMVGMSYRCMRVIEHALSAKREYSTKDGQVYSGGPDHYARLAATKHFRDFVMAGRPAPKHPEPKGRSFTLQEIEEAIAAAEAERSQRAA